MCAVDYNPECVLLCYANFSVLNAALMCPLSNYFLKKLFHIHLFCMIFISILISFYNYSVTGEASIAAPLTWHQRLKIALDSAQGIYKTAQ